MARVYSVCVAFFLMTSGFSTVAQEGGEDEPLLNPTGDSAAGQQEQAVRQSFLNLLKSDVEPNLPQADVQKLNRSVQRLGSYRDEWAEQARSFLVANAAVAELYLYRYALLKNPRLNKRILETLKDFQSLRFPRASLAFAEVFSDQKSDYLSVLALATRQDPSMGFESFQWVMNTWGGDLSLREKLHFLSQTCPAWKKAGSPLSEMIAAVVSQANQFWEQVFAEEVRSCMKGY